MLRILTTTLFLFATFCSFGQDNNPKVLTYEIAVTGDFLKNTLGGINNDYTYLGMEDVSLNFDLENLGLWNGAELFIHGLNMHGRAPSQEIVGDLQVSSNIEAGNYTAFYEYYLSQTAGNFLFIIGQHDLNSEFVGTEYGGTFINSSFGVFPTLSINIPVSIYPTTGPAIITKFRCKDHHVFKLGVYDGDPGDPESNRYNLQPNLSLNEGILLISEYEHQHSLNGLPETYKLGTYYHTAEFTNYYDTLFTKRGNYGFYGITDFVLFSDFKKPNTYLSLFFQAAWAPPGVNQVNYYLGGGLHLNSMLFGRYNNVLGLAVAHASMGQPIRSLAPNMLKAETAIELTYKIDLLEDLWIQPNLQYIINPGVNPELKNSLVALMRFNLSLSNAD